MIFDQIHVDLARQHPRYNTSVAIRVRQCSELAECTAIVDRTAGIIIPFCEIYIAYSTILYPRVICVHLYVHFCHLVSYISCVSVRTNNSSNSLYMVCILRVACGDIYILPCYNAMVRFVQRTLQCCDRKSQKERLLLYCFTND